MKYFVGFALLGLLVAAISQAPAQYPNTAPKKDAPPAKKDGVNINIKNPLKEDGSKPKRPNSGPEGPKIVFEGDGDSKKPGGFGPVGTFPPSGSSSGSQYSPGSSSQGSSSSSSSSSTKVTIKVTKEITKITETIELDLHAKVVELPKACFPCNGFKVKAFPFEKGNCDYVRFTSGRTVVWFVVTPTKENEPYTIYPPFCFRMAGGNPIAQEQDWLMEYVEERLGEKRTVWQSRIRVKPEPGFKPKGATAVFDVCRPFEGAKIKAATPFILSIGNDQGWWGTCVPGYQGRMEADVVAGYPLMLRFPYAGQANFEGRGQKVLGPVIVEE